MVLVYFSVGMALGLAVGWKVWGSSLSLGPSPAWQAAYQLSQAMVDFKGEFLVRVSHEIRAPLNGIIGTHQLILGDLCTDPQEERELLGLAHQSSLKLCHILDVLLQVARVSCGKVPLAKESVALTPLLTEVQQLLELPAQDRNLDLQLLPPSPEVWVLGDPSWLRQLLIYAGSRALTVAGSGPIHLCADGLGDKVRVWVDYPVASPEPAHPSLGLSPGLDLLTMRTIIEPMGGTFELSVVPGTNYQQLNMTFPRGNPCSDPGYLLH